LSMIASSFASILSSTTSSRVTSLEPTTDSAFLISLFSLLASFALMLAPQDDRLIKHLQHLVADVKGPESPQEVKSAQALFIDGLRGYHLHIRPTDAENRRKLRLRLGGVKSG